MRRRVLILVAAFMLAAFSGVAVLAYANSADRRALSGRQGKWVLLATATIPANTTVSAIRSKRLIRQVLMPAETVPSGALSKLDNTLDALRLNAPLLPDQMLMRRQFETISVPSASPTFRIPPKRIAVSVALDVAAQVAGNVEAGAKVAVYCTSPVNAQAGQTVKTFVVLPSATVITSGESEWLGSTPTPIPTPGVTTAPTVVPTQANPTVSLKRYLVTLSVTQRESEMLILAAHVCYLHLGMLGPSATVTAPPSMFESELPS
jgi:pilus assembly protein CpaB